MNENNFTSYAVDRKPEGKFGLLRIGLIALYIAFALLGFLIVYTIGIIPVYAICPLLLYILWLATWRYTQVTYEYTVEVGDITFTRSYGGRKKVEMLRIHVREATAIHPTEDEVGVGYTAVYDFRSSTKAPDSYCIVFLNEKEERCLAYFEATRKAIKLLSLYNSAAVSGKKELRY